MPQNRKCSVPKCGLPHEGRGYCNKHYMRYYRYGDPLACSPNKHKLVKFLKQYSFYQGNECVLWPFSKNPTGYGQFKYEGSSNAHRVMCRMAHGNPPTPKHRATHSCPNRACINPNHLSWKRYN